MKLRDHVDTAILILRYAPASPPEAGLWPPQVHKRFWNQVQYLEFLWARKLDRLLKTSQHSRLLGLVEEILVTGLLIRVVVGACRQPRGESQEVPLSQAWERYRVRSQELIESCRQPGTPGVARLERLRRRLHAWEHFLESNSTKSGPFPLPASSNKPHSSGSSSIGDASWPLLQMGVSQVIGPHCVDDAVRAAVHRSLQDDALRLIPSGIFLEEGQIKPHFLRLIDVASTVLS